MVPFRGSLFNPVKEYLTIETEPQFLISNLNEPSGSSSNFIQILTSEFKMCKLTKTAILCFFK